MSTIALLSQHRGKYQKGKGDTPFVSIIVAMYNEDAVIEACHQRISATLDTLNKKCEIVYVDDGSQDKSWELVSNFSSDRHQLTRVRFSRNFGKEAAMSAGLQAATGQAVILIDADLQDPPELIPAMVEKWLSGFDVVDMQRRKRHGESWFKRTTAAVFYKLMNNLSEMPIPQNVGDFRLIDRRVVNEINKLPERTRFMKGLFAWPGFRRTTIRFDRDPRKAGETKWNYTQLVHLAFEGITSFSTRPLRMATGAGLLTSFAAVVMAIVVFTKTMIWGDPVAGYPSTIMVVLLLGGVQLLSIGLMGEYVGRLFIEAKQRPLFVVMDENIQGINTHHEEAKA